MGRSSYMMYSNQEKTETVIRYSFKAMACGYVGQAVIERGFYITTRKETLSTRR